MSFKEHILRFETVESTMAEALKAAQQGAEAGTTVLASSQTAGRGRRGRDLYSERGAGLFATTVIYPKEPREKVHQLSLVTGVAIHKALGKLGAQDALLKWPNDILVGNKKLCGILLECVEVKTAKSPHGYAVLIGYGINLKRSQGIVLNDEIKSLYIGLNELSDQAQNIDGCLELILEELEAGIKQWSQEGLAPTLSYWQSADALLGKTVQAQSANGPITATACGLDDQGRLILKNGEDLQVVDSGEVFEIR
jgi:BirA family biotin operon repressor/biotin-[acetyl-CoA-carboxylase] ligase